VVGSRHRRDFTDVVRQPDGQIDALQGRTAAAMPVLSSASLADRITIGWNRLVDIAERPRAGAFGTIGTIGNRHHSEIGPILSLIRNRPLRAALR
jgi:hypothetical protein